LGDSGLQLGALLPLDEQVCNLRVSLRRLFFLLSFFFRFRLLGYRFPLGFSQSLFIIYILHFSTTLITTTSVWWILRLHPSSATWTPTTILKLQPRHSIGTGPEPPVRVTLPMLGLSNDSLRFPCLAFFTWQGLPIHA
jgi:hypothetical protein